MILSTYAVDKVLLFRQCMKVGRYCHSLETFRGNEHDGRVSDLEGTEEVYSLPDTQIPPGHA